MTADDEVLAIERHRDWILAGLHERANVINQQVERDMELLDSLLTRIEAKVAEASSLLDQAGIK